MKLYFSSILAILIAAPAAHSTLSRRAGEAPDDNMAFLCNTNDKSASVANLEIAAADMSSWPEKSCTSGWVGSAARMAAGGE